MTDLGFHAASELAALIRRREMSSRELLDHYVARIERYNPRLNAVVTLDVERARARADAADAALARGETWGPLHGLPITIKDTIETAGLRTTAGSPDLADRVPAADAPAVRRLVDAGAVVFGKSNAPLMAGDWQTYNAVFGTTNNPWDTARAPGGSSGGAAAAVAAGLTAAELGSDIGGSIRVPSHWCGVYGHKPSYGIIPTRGHIPGPPGTLTEVDLAVLGPLGRSAADLDVMLGLLAGPLDDRATAWRLDLPSARRASLRDYRVAAWLDDPAYPVDREVTERLHAVVDGLRAAGVAVDETARPGFALSDAVETYLRLLFPVLISGFVPALAEQLSAVAADPPPGLNEMLAQLARFGTARHTEWLIANETREQMRARCAEFFRRYDVLLCPVNQVPAIPHDHHEPLGERVIVVNGAECPYPHLFAWIAVPTMAGLPATAAPAGRTAAGLPVGVQVIGPFLEDRTTIDFARRLAEVCGGYEPPPGY